MLGFDGARADSLVNIRQSGVTNEDGQDIYSGDNPNAKYSAINHIVDDLGGKMYIAYAGGDKKKNYQAPSTAPGWASITTGAWGTANGVIDNPHDGLNVKNLNKKTFMLEYAESQNLRTTFMASWSAHKETYKKEIDYIKEKNLPMEYSITEDDYILHENLLSCVEEGGENEKDIIFAIYDWAGHNGHSTGFTNDNKNYVNAVKK